MTDLTTPCNELIGGAAGVGQQPVSAEPGSAGPDTQDERGHDDDI